jgi:hypothetical protein
MQLVADSSRGWRERQRATEWQEPEEDDMMAVMKERPQAGWVALGAAAVLAVTILSGCSYGIPLRTDPALHADAKGSYRLYLYGCHYASDIEDMALLVDESAPYRFELFVLDTSYRIQENLPGPDALEKANEFIRCSTERVWLTSFRRIIDPAGKTIAFELKPLYDPVRMGLDEVLQTNYAVKDGTVTVFIRRNPLLRREDGGNESRGRGER